MDEGTFLYATYNVHSDGEYSEIGLYSMGQYESTFLWTLYIKSRLVVT